jgi:TolA-binding protein
MRNRTQTSASLGFARRFFQILSLLLTICLSVQTTSTTFAQKAATVDPAVEKMYKQAQEKSEAGDFKGAAEIYESMIAKYPKIDAIWQLRYNLAYCYYLLGMNEQAVTNLQKTSTKENPDENLRERAAIIMCSAQSNLAKAQTNLDKKHQMLEESIRLFNNFLREYPKSQSRGDAFYGKAVAYFFADKPDDAEKNLQEYFKIGRESLKMEANYLLARVYTTQGKNFDANQKHDEARACFEKAKQIYDNFISGAKDLVLANESLLSAGDVMIQNGSYADAVRILHNVKPKEYIESKQVELLKGLHHERTQAMAAGNQSLADDLGQQYDRARNRLASVQGQDTIYFKALQLISQAYFSQQKYDEVLLLNHHMMPFYTDDFKKMANYILIKALIQKESFEEASQEYTKFSQAFPKDTLGEDIVMTFARCFSKANKYDDCIKWAEVYKANYPAGKDLEEAYFMVADANTKNGNLKEAQVASDAFRLKFPNSTLVGETLFYTAYASYQKKDYATASADFRDFANKYPDSENARYALLNMADCYSQLRHYDAAIKILKEFETKYSKTDLFPKALYALAKAYEHNKEFDAANETYARVVKDYASQDVAAFSQYGIGMNYLMGNKAPEADAAFNQFIKLFPDHSLAPNAYFFKAEILRNMKKTDDAIAAYQTIVTKYPQAESAADSLVTLGDVYSQKATQMAARPEKLAADKQELWKGLSQKSQESYEQVVKSFPNNSNVDKALSQISLLWLYRVNAKFNSKDDAMAYFNKLSAESNASLQIKVSFTLGGLMGLLNDQESALDVLSKAYDKAGAISLPNEGYKQFRTALLAGKQFDKAREVSERQLREKQETGDEQGVAEAQLGIGQAYFEKGDYISAATHLSEVVTKYPWAEVPANESEFLLDRIEEQNKNYDQAIAKFKALAQKARDPELKVRIFLNSGYVWLEKSEAAPQGKMENLKEALGYFLRVGTAFSAFPKYAAEGLYMSANIYEKYAALTMDPKAKAESITNATKFYKKCVDDYSTTPWAEQSRDRLKYVGK